MTKPQEFNLDELPEDLLVCNCAGCNRLLCGLSQKWEKGLPPKPRGKVNDRPYCHDCLTESGYITKGGLAKKHKLGKPDPLHERMIKIFKDFQ